MTVFCTSCGQQNPQGAKFCSQCGAALPGADQPERLSDTTSTISISGIDSTDLDHDEALPDSELVDTLLPGSALLVVRHGPSAGSRFLLDKDATTAGRHPDSDIFLDDVTVSRRHAEFIRRPGAGSGFVVRDVGSLNGTYLNRERIEEAALTSGDEVQVGKFRLLFLAAHPAGRAGGGHEGAAARGPRG
jgi:pSer/pThr/pTyr-binding forkhead associated (FHA) protein